MVYMGSDGKKHKAVNFMAWKKRGESKLYLVLLIPFTSPGKPHGWFEISYGGKLASTAPNYRECYEVHYSRQTQEFRDQATEAIEYILKNGTPIDNDESVFD